MSGTPVVFVTGANRGIGLEFVRQLVTRKAHVFAGYRSQQRSRELLTMAKKRDNLDAVLIDVTDEHQINKAREIVAHAFERLDMLINNAGIQINYDGDVDDVEPDEIMENFRVNVVGPFLTAKIFHPLLAEGTRPKIINITSQMGSIEQASGNAVPYRISKAGVNMLTKNQASAYAGDGIITVALHPGWVRTDMGGSGAPLSPQESVSGMLKVIDGLKEADNGRFIGFDGRPRSY
jgi:NAD(P)-dependent dehydrogenase (short-subunit alcohol dehydrogenase family)